VEQTKNWRVDDKGKNCLKCSNAFARYNVLSQQL